MRIPDKFAYLGGVSSAPFQKENCINCDIKYSCKYRQMLAQLEKLKAISKASWEKARILYFSIKDNLKIHVSKKQELYWPLLISAVLLFLTFISSRTAFSKTIEPTNNLPIKDSYKIKLIGTNLENSAGKICSSKNEEYQKNIAKRESKESKNKLKEDIERIVKNTPMAAMVDPISEKDRTVAAFLVGIAMKESKFGIYSPRLGGRDCYNYWGFKGGGRTVAGGYSCFSSPDEAVEAVSGRIEKMVSRGIHTPAQAIGWKCGSSCAGHGAESVRKWISDVAVNFYKINS